MDNRDHYEVLPSLKNALLKIENDHDTNPAMPQLREILLKRIADLEELKRKSESAK